MKEEKKHKRNGRTREVVDGSCKTRECAPLDLFI